MDLQVRVRIEEYTPGAFHVLGDCGDPRTQWITEGTTSATDFGGRQKAMFGHEVACVWGVVKEQGWSYKILGWEQDWGTLGACTGIWTETSRSALAMELCPAIRG